MINTHLFREHGKSMNIIWHTPPQYQQTAKMSVLTMAITLLDDNSIE